MTPRRIVVVALTAAALASSYALFRAGASAGTSAPEARTFELVIENRQLALGPPVLEAREGDSITLAVTSDTAGTLHVHEYEQHIVLDLVPGQDAVSTFVADRAGRFGVHLIWADGSHNQVASVEVQPR
jgi:hypothetical protein